MGFFVNIHTHKKPQLYNEIAIRNAYHYCLNHENINYQISIGIHPWLAKNIDYYDMLMKMGSCKKVAAIGECGLDTVKGDSICIQEKVFAMHIDVANFLKKPLILHIVKAYHLLPKFLKNIKVPVIIHGYNTSAQQTIAFLKYEFIYFSFGLNLVNNSNKILESFNIIPLERLFFETDNNNIPIDFIYNEASKLKNITTEKLTEIVFENYKSLFLS